MATVRVDKSSKDPGQKTRRQKLELLSRLLLTRRDPCAHRALAACSCSCSSCFPSVSAFWHSARHSAPGSRQLHASYATPASSDALSGSGRAVQAAHATAYFHEPRWVFTLLLLLLLASDAQTLAQARMGRPGCPDPPSVANSHPARPAGSQAPSNAPLTPPASLQVSVSSVVHQTLPDQIEAML